MGNLGLCRQSYWPRNERATQRVLRAAQRGNWSRVFREMVEGESVLDNALLSTAKEQILINTAMAQDEYMKIPELLNRGYWFTQRLLEDMIYAAAEENQMVFLVCMMCSVRGYTFSWPCVVRALDAFSSQDEYLDKAKYLLMTSVPRNADKSLLEPIHARLKERPSNHPDLKRTVLKQLSDLLKD